ncbi:MAG: gamma-glutamyl-gamma-aminobutyrate hydrolase family protein [Microbacterium sp.]|uniref:gamma-glutamyl-gamma-aminobutyrate hydrolase family protein n=1 Tax=Microbacterium sp. TaxID=51671 RepID=UPI00281C3D6C|nr:gamma-glutamyl-gamma-aminobutyrate hydrolase family protein [Microbacterium sp.]MDR2323295.1 gamma-glutamyl-gamma-aminobutyrate hydrolase family protein [Microbacterium sp.]
MTEPRPVVGLTTYRQAADWGTWRQVEADLLPSDYARSIERAGGVPLLLPPVAAPGAAGEVLARLDGLLIAGGADVNPARYGQEPDPSVVRWYDDRDAWELALLAEADRIRLPLLGICRGMQLMAVAAGGTLVQHLPDVVGHGEHGGGPTSYGSASVRVDAEGRVAGLVAPEITVPVHHHQAVAQHPGYLPVAHDADGVLQAMEAEGDRFAVGVQWHPETDEDPGLFDGLIAAAKERLLTR